ncbi:MAG: hypothetical protein ACHQF2_05860 [Flavobacteriales bacterium]
MKSKLYTFIILALIGCDRAPTVEKEEKTQDVIQAIPYHVDDPFTYDAFYFPLTVEDLMSQYEQLKVTATPTTNIHEKSITDTILKLSMGKTEFVIYRAKHRDLFQSAYIVTDDVVLKNNVRVGITKEDFGKKMGLNITDDKIQIGDTENNSYWVFTFKRDKLAIIEFDGYID